MRNRRNFQHNSYSRRVKLQKGPHIYVVEKSVPFFKPMQKRDLLAPYTCRGMLIYIPRKCYICTTNLCTGKHPAENTQRSTFPLDLRGAIFSTKMFFTWTVSLLLTSLDARLKFCFTNTCTSDGSASWKHAESFSNLNSVRHAGSWKVAFTVTKAPAQVFNISSPGTQDLGITSLFLKWFLTSI